jgi:hypothetical protein
MVGDAHPAGAAAFSKKKGESSLNTTIFLT